MSEKWSDRIYTNKQSIEANQKAQELFLNKPHPDIYNVVELKKNEFEKKTISKSIDALNLKLEELGFPVMQFSEKRFHILSREEYKAKVHGESGGMAQYGHIYLIRNDDRARFLNDVTHELVHTASFVAFQVDIGTTETGDIGYKIGLRRAGLKFLNQKPETEKANFVGLNEAVTELFAHDLRLTMVEDFSELTDKEKHKSKDSGVYFETILLLDKLISTVSTKFGDKKKDVIDELFKNYLTAEYSFLKKLDKYKKGAVKILFNMGGEPEDALKAAEALGFDDVVEKIKKLINKKSQPES